MSISSKNEEIIGNNYRLGKSIGEGTFGKVRLGIHILTDQKVAVKTLQKDKIVQQSDIERVTREICILKILRHPNIIQLYEIIETKTAIHLIMEYAEGGQLFDYIVKNKRVEETEASRFLQQILSGVQYIHKNGIVHRDLKPQNLLLDSNKNIKIVDFGLSNQYKTGQKLKTACGSPCYAAPEMIAGKRYDCLNVDIWSCGIIIYAMLCGYLPFEDANTNKLYKKIIAGDFQMPKFLSAESRDILRNILNVNPETRYKIPQIRGTKWYNLYKNQAEIKGIIVGKDPIPIDEAVIKKMSKFDFDSVQARTYVLNNRHNHVTAMYYLLMKKIEKQPKIEIEEEPAKKKEKKNISAEKERESSPLIYRPDKKPDVYIPNKKSVKDPKDSSKNDSINASNIISSLVQANKGKLLTQRFARKPQGTNFDKQEDFKNFPKKMNTSVHESDSGKKIALNSLTSRSGAGDDKSFESKRSSINAGDVRKFGGSHGLNYSVELQHGEVPNKKRQELSEQLKQISVKIDKQINDLKKQHEGSNEVEFNKRQSFGPYVSGITSASNRKKPSQSFTANTSGDRLRLSQNFRESPQNSYLNSTLNPSTPSGYTSSERNRIMSQGNNYNQGYNNSSSHQGPKSHVGPFNAKCLFLENAASLMKKISQFLKDQNVRYIEQEPFTFKTYDNHSVWLQTISGGVGLHLVNFSKNFPKNDELLEILAQ